jgi:ribonuclease BN (tRNA processing enzyme)
MFNNIIWPDFTTIPAVDRPVLSFREIEAGHEFTVSGYKIMAVEVNHTVPAVGYIVSADGKTLAYTGDTGPTEEIWHHVSGVDALIVEVSFPNSMEPLALLTGHLTCSLLHVELQKITKLPRHILITHPKPQYYDIIRKEIDSLDMKEIELLHDGAVYEF